LIKAEPRLAGKPASTPLPFGGIHVRFHLVRSSAEVRLRARTLCGCCVSDGLTGSIWRDYLMSGSGTEGRWLGDPMHARRGPPPLCMLFGPSASPTSTARMDPRGSPTSPS